ncbi:hypothetical protein [Novosphingobium sp. Gsoil 351]|uniref:hypothetical protein n=1 Tax=Novosphingobium sp. Gsoil 351 TaxID=2675225 RepID=UPI0012B4E36F|nr:hypothetical protein [Novosphingobium sp. Gsoil 351]QGN54166.1 hypothetical protein GKE62_06020 [Novosphingobium sp. Gsoil 351]
MNIPTLTHNGRVHLDHAHFNDAIEFTLDHWSYEIQGGCHAWNFLPGAAAIAAEVFASGAEWEPIARRYAEAARKTDMPPAKIHRLLALAWEWAGYSRGCWIEMCHEWIYVEGHDSYFHLTSGRSVDREDFLDLFDNVLTDPSGDLKRAFNQYPARVDRVVRDPATVRGFYELEGALVFNAA